MLFSPRGCCSFKCIKPRTVKEAGLPKSHIYVFVSVIVPAPRPFVKALFYVCIIMENYDRYFEANKELWNKRTAVHKESSFYDLAGFRKGANTLTPIELNEVGDVAGKSLF